MNTMNKNKNKDGNVHSQAKTRHKTYDPTTRLPRASLLVKAGEGAPGSMGEWAEAGLASRAPHGEHCLSWVLVLSISFKCPVPCSAALCSPFSYSYQYQLSTCSTIPPVSTPSQRHVSQWSVVGAALYPRALPPGPSLSLPSVLAWRVALHRKPWQSSCLISYLGEKGLKGFGSRRFHWWGCMHRPREALQKKKRQLMYDDRDGFIFLVSWSYQNISEKTRPGCSLETTCSTYQHLPPTYSKWVLWAYKSQMKVNPLLTGLRCNLKNHPEQEVLLAVGYAGRGWRGTWVWVG